MADHLSIPGAFTYLRIVPESKPQSNANDNVSNETERTAVVNLVNSQDDNVPIEASLNTKLSYSEHSNSTEGIMNRSTIDATTSSEDNKTTPSAPVVAIDIWKQKTHDRKQHFYDFDRFMNEGIAPDPGTLSDTTADWSTIKVHHDLFDVAVGVLEIAQSQNEDNLLRFNKGPALAEGGILFQHAVKLWLLEHDMLDRIHLEWVGGMTTLGQVVESEGSCNCETNYYDNDDEKDEKNKKNNSKASINSVDKVNLKKLTTNFLTPSIPGSILQKHQSSLKTSSYDKKISDNDNMLNSNVEPTAPLVIKAGKTGRRLTLMLNKRLVVRKNVVASLLDHEICTHAIRFANEWEQPWAGGRRCDFGLSPSTSREVASAEEGLATINGLLNKPQDQRLLIHPALMYVAASAGEGKTFKELFDYLGKFVQSPSVRFGLCRKAKVGSGSELNAIGRKQIYFEGAVAVLRALVESDAKVAAYEKEKASQTEEMSETPSSTASATSTGFKTPTSRTHRINFPQNRDSTIEWDPVALHCARIPVVDPSSSRRFLKVLNTSTVTLPHFLRSPEDIGKYKETLRQIAKLNGIKSLAEEKVARDLNECQQVGEGTDQEAVPPLLIPPTMPPPVQSYTPSAVATKITSTLSTTSTSSNKRASSCSPIIRANSTTPSSPQLTLNSTTLPVINGGSNRRRGSFRTAARSPSPSLSKTHSNSLPDIFQANINKSNNGGFSSIAIDESQSRSRSNSVTRTTTSSIPPRPMKPLRNRNHVPSPGSSLNTTPIKQSSNKPTEASSSPPPKTMADEMKLFKEKLARAAQEHSKVTRQAVERKESGTRNEWELLLDKCKEEIKAVDVIVSRSETEIALEIDSNNINENNNSNAILMTPKLNFLNGKYKSSILSHKKYLRQRSGDHGNDDKDDDDESDEEEAEVDDNNNNYETELWKTWIAACSVITNKKLAVVHIQAWYRSIKPRHDFQIQLRAIDRIQSVVRGGLARKGKCLPFYEPSDADRAFLKAVSLGQRTVAETWMAKGANIRARNDHGHPAVTLAARNGQLAVLEWLHGLSLCSKSDDGRSCASIAAWYGHLNILEYIKIATDRVVKESLSSTNLDRRPMIGIKGIREKNEKRSRIRIKSDGVDGGPTHNLKKMIVDQANDLKNSDPASSNSPSPGNSVNGDLNQMTEENDRRQDVHINLDHNSSSALLRHSIIPNPSSSSLKTRYSKLKFEIQESRKFLSTYEYHNNNNQHNSLVSVIDWKEVEKVATERNEGKILRWLKYQK